MRLWTDALLTTLLAALLAANLAAKLAVNLDTKLAAKVDVLLAGLALSQALFSAVKLVKGNSRGRATFPRSWRCKVRTHNVCNFHMFVSHNSKCNTPMNKK